MEEYNDKSKKIILVNELDIEYLCSLFPRRLLEGKVGKQDEFIFELRSRENGHNSPHIHAKTSQGELSIDIVSFNIIHQSGKFRNGAIKKAKEWVINNAEMLQKKWNELPNPIKIPIY